MQIKNSKFLKVWEIEEKGKSVMLKLSEGKKKEDGTYDNWHWNAFVVGEDVEEAKKLKKEDVIDIKDGIIEKHKKDDVWYETVTIFKFEKSKVKEEKPKEVKKEKPKEVKKVTAPKKAVKK